MLEVIGVCVSRRACHGHDKVLSVRSLVVSVVVPVAAVVVSAVSDVKTSHDEAATRAAVTRR